MSAELIKRLRSDVQTADCDCERCILFREAADRITALERQNAELVRQLAAQSEDVARYRWLRDSPFSGQSIRAIYEDGMAVPAAVDAFIDQAMQSGKEPK